MVACSSIASITWSPTVVTGLRLVIGSWKIMPILAPRTARISGTGRERRSRPSNSIRAPGSMRPGLGTSRMMASAVIDLPQPDSPTSASVSPVAIEKPTRSTTRMLPALAGKRDGEPFDRQQGRAHRSSRRVRGSMMSRMASAITLTASTSVKRAMEAPARFHQMTGVRDSSLRAWSIIWPQLPSSPMPR